MKQAGFFDFSQRQDKLLQTQDFLEHVNRLVAWESFRPLLESAIERKDSGKGGRPAFNLVLMFKILVLQALYNLSDEQTEASCVFSVLNCTTTCPMRAPSGCSASS